MLSKRNRDQRKNIMEREIRFRFVNRNKKTGKISMVYTSINDLEMEDSWQGPVNFERLSVDLCTSLKDKNGRDIYEGDLLDFDEREWGGPFNPEVMSMENMIGDWNYCGSLSDVSEWRQVIGNVYENSDLLQ